MHRGLWFLLDRCSSCRLWSRVAVRSAPLCQTWKRPAAARQAGSVPGDIADGWQESGCCPQVWAHKGLQHRAVEAAPAMARMGRQVAFQMDPSAEIVWHSQLADVRRLSSSQQVQLCWGCMLICSRTCQVSACICCGHAPGLLQLSALRMTCCAHVRGKDISGLR